MAYTDEAVRAKLSALNETQESIVTVAQWVMFHRRHAERTAALWLQKLKDSNSGKRLNLIYLANEVAQQSKVRRKDDFLLAFSPIIAEATAVAYRGAATEVQAKLRRSVEVWRTRQIFELDIQQAIESRLDELDRSRSNNKKPALGGSLFSGPATSTVPTELQPLLPLQLSLSRATTATISAVPTSIDTEYDTLTDPATTTPPPPVYAAKLSALFKTLAAAECAVAESLNARKALVEGLERILEVNRAAIGPEETRLQDLASKKDFIGSKKREVEDSIMRGLSADVSAQHHIHSNGVDASEDLRPDVEELTPPPDEHSKGAFEHFTGDAMLNNSASMPLSDFMIPTEPSTASAGADLLSSLSLPTMGQLPAGFAGMGKKRKAEEDDINLFPGAPGDAMSGLDDDVAQLLQDERK